MRNKLALEGRSESIDEETEGITDMKKQRIRPDIQRARCSDKVFSDNTIENACAKISTFGSSLFPMIS